MTEINTTELSVFHENKKYYSSAQSARKDEFCVNETDEYYYNIHDSNFVAIYVNGKLLDEKRNTNQYVTLSGYGYNQTWIDLDNNNYETLYCDEKICIKLDIRKTENDLQKEKYEEIKRKINFFKSKTKYL